MNSEYYNTKYLQYKCKYLALVNNLEQQGAGFVEELKILEEEMNQLEEERDLLYQEYTNKIDLIGNKILELEKRADICRIELEPYAKFRERGDMSAYKCITHQCSHDNCRVQDDDLKYSPYGDKPPCVLKRN